MLLRELLNYNGTKTSNESMAVAKKEKNPGKKDLFKVKIFNYGIDAGNLYKQDNPYLKEKDSYATNGGEQYKWVSVSEECYNYYVKYLESEPKNETLYRNAQRLLNEGFN